MPGSHNLFDKLAEAGIELPASGKFLYIPSASKYLFEFGSGVPTGTPTSLYYFRTDPVDNAAIYADVSGTWTAQG